MCASSARLTEALVRVQAPEDSPCSSPLKGRLGSGAACFEGFTYSAPSILAGLAAEPSSLLAS